MMLQCNIMSHWLGTFIKWSVCVRCGQLIHWGRVMHICVSKIIIIGSDNGLALGRCQAIIWTNAGLSLIGPLGINLSEILIKIQNFSFMKMHLKMSSAKWRLFRLVPNVLRPCHHITYTARMGILLYGVREIWFWNLQKSYIESK